LREPGEADPLKELIELFIKDARPRMARLEQAVGEKSAFGMETTAHTLKGSANNLGARQMALLCSQLEKAGKAGDFSEAANILLDLKSEFQRVERALLAELAK
jgi:histidine phosphotransfer protein HptB